MLFFMEKNIFMKDKSSHRKVLGQQMLALFSAEFINSCNNCEFYIDGMPFLL